MHDSTSPMGSVLPPRAWPGLPAGALSGVIELAPLPIPCEDGFVPPATPAQAPAHEMRMLVAVSRALSHSGDLRASLRRALECLRAGVGARTCTVWLLREDGGLKRAVRAGLTPEYLRAVEMRSARRMLRALAADALDVVLLDGDDLLDPHNLCVPEAHSLLSLRSVCAIPLATPNYRVGWLTLGHHEERWFRRHSTEFYRSLGEILANAIDNARLFEELRSSDERHAGLLRSAHDGIGCLDTHGRFTEANPAIESLLGRPRARILGRRLLEFVPRAQHEALRGVFTELTRPGARVTDVRLDVVNANGESVPLVANGSPLHGQHGIFQGIVFVVQDERERRANERRERAAMRTLELMLQHLDHGVALVDAHDERVVSCNAAFARLVGGSGRELIGQPLAEVCPSYEASGCAMLVRDAARRLANRMASDVPVQVGERAPEYWTIGASPLPPIAEGRSLVLLTVSDTTSRRVIDDRLRQSQKLAAVGTLAGGIAHEYNNLLTTILGHLSIALADLPDSHSLVPGLRDSEAAAQRAADLTRQLLGFGRRAPLETRPIVVHRVVEDLAPLLRRTFDPKHEVRTEFDAEPWVARVDSQRLTEALVHLCLNARDAMPGSGAVTMAVHNVHLDARSGAGSGDYVRIDVRDTGVGMPPEVLARMYEPFYTTKGSEGGTGLGLTSVHVIVEQHHGWIECESAPGRGTRFSVYLPRWKAPMPSDAAPRTVTVLVVDDEPAVRSLAQQVLERQGYQVTTAADGLEAIGRLEAGERPDLVLLDLTMPRLSGAETMRRLHDLVPGLRVVLTTGFGAVSTVEAGLMAQAFLPKPFTPARLAELVREVLELRRNVPEESSEGRPSA